MDNNTLPSAKSNHAKVKQKHYDKPHMIIPQEDFMWARKQIPCVKNLWEDCWIADPYGSRMMQLNTSLPNSTFMKAKKVLADAGLFVFNRKTSTRDSRETVCWEVQNLHGSRVKAYWKKVSVNEPDHHPDTTSSKRDTTSHQLDTTSSKLDTTSHQLDSISTQTLTQQESCNPSVTSHKHLSNSSEELLRCVEPTSCNENLLSHLQDATRGVMPPKEVIEHLRDSNYWEGFRAAARMHGWDLTQYHKPTMSSEMQEQFAEQMRSLKEKIKYKTSE